MKLYELSGKQFDKVNRDNYKLHKSLALLGIFLN